MNNKSMTESELKEFLTALRDNCGSKKKMEWYHGLIDDIGIAFTEHTADAGEMLEEAKSLWQNGNKLEAVKLMCQSGYRLKDAKNYCDENFGLLPNLPKSTENLSKIADKDEWLNEVRGNEGLRESLSDVVISNYGRIEGSDEPQPIYLADLGEDVLDGVCNVAKQYSDSKLYELEKWIDEQFKHADSLDKQDDTVTRYFSGKKDGLSLIKIKIQSLKQ